MPIKYDKLLDLLKGKGYTTYKIRKDNIMSQSAWQKIRTGTGDIDTCTISQLCGILNCQPGDIMEYASDESIESDDIQPVVRNVPQPATEQ